MRICVLASGSKGNSTFIETTRGTKILIDAGLSKSELEQRLSKIEVMPTDIDAILVTHEHSDHTKGILQFSKKYGTKIYVHQKNWNTILNKVGEIPLSSQVEFGDKMFAINDLAIQSFQLDHDSNHCVGFSIYENNKKFCTATDLGHTTPTILNELKTSDFVLLESNHDVIKLKNNQNYPAKLKNRIMSQHGHLSNEQTAEAIFELLGNTPRGVILAHLSEQNNSPEIAIQTIKQTLISRGANVEKEIRIDVASQEHLSNIYRIKD